MRPLQIREIAPGRDRLGESPFWDERSGTLGWIDSLEGRLHRLDPATGEAEVHALPAPVGSVAPCEHGDAVVVALKDRLARYDRRTRALRTLAELPQAHPGLRFNDGKCDPFGHFLAGTLHYDRAEGELPAGGLYRLSPEGRLQHLAGDIALANGPCFSPDGRRFYLADSAARAFWCWDYGPEGLDPDSRRIFVRTDALGSGPDGATVDAEGFLWTALVRTGQLARFAPDGRLDRLVAVPATHPTSLCFGGPGLARAYVTSISRSTRLTGTRAEDGGVFEICGLPAPGLPVHRFGG